jgi:hypothetical protein
MQSVDLIMHSLTHLNIGGLIAIVLWIMWVISLTANTSWPVAFAGQDSHVCSCMYGPRVLHAATGYARPAAIKE